MKIGFKITEKEIIDDLTLRNLPVLFSARMCYRVGLEKGLKAGFDIGRGLAYQALAETLDLHKNTLGFAEISNHINYAEIDKLWTEKDAKEKK